VEGLAAFLGEETDHRHVEYFQGLGRFREQGLPGKLPADRTESPTESPTESLERDPGFLELEQEVQSLKKMEVDQATLDKAKRKLSGIAVLSIRKLSSHIRRNGFDVEGT
jgi:hypothetical protein